ncbi:thermostable hemolysin [Novosphingobium colocasiae]|uniref:Thermostable hemolysin n=1 Tax=Novosphingobium colocasiae TaxID=1256513 RepID=A0A918UK66_9SPHN|nr:thermostable hemolysin [Novosphingobium colocasiae]GGZ15869.1 hypothetical protein GCM10011614_33430 [Novosphingobium colocasiae]
MPQHAGSRTLTLDLVSCKFRDAFGASARPAYVNWLHLQRGAALGYRRADQMPLFLEVYLDAPIEHLVAGALGRPVARDAIVEIGNFAADSAPAMLALWVTAANDLGGCSEVAVATLTAPVRRMFVRIGLPIVEIAPARAERLGAVAAEWGSYYDHDPIVCAGVIAEGQAAIAAFLDRRTRSTAA